MVRIPECEGMLSPLLRSIQDKTAPTADHVDVYLTLTERLREEKEDFVAEICQHTSDLTVQFKRDAASNETDLSQAALQALGHCLYHDKIARSFSVEQASDILQVLVHLADSTEDKGICTRTLWCIAKQNLPVDIILQQVDKVLSCLTSLHTKDIQSATVDYEVVCVVERLLAQLPVKIMGERANSWCRTLFKMTVSSALKVRDQATLVLMTNLQLLVSCQQNIIPWLLPELKSGLVSKLSKLCSEKNEVHVLKVWSCIVPVLGRVLHKGSFLNEMLKLVEQGFKNPSVNVQVSSYSAWRVLIDNFALSQDVLCTPKRVKLIMMPFLNCAVREKNERVEAARLSTWWHFICCFHPEKVAELFDQICVPLLQFIFGTAIDQTSLLKSKGGFSELKCPPTPTDGKLMAEREAVTPKSQVRRSLVGTPKTPSVIHSSFAQAAKLKLLMQGCHILAQLLQREKSLLKGDIRFSLAESIRGCVFQTPDTFERYAVILISATREAFKACGHELDDKLTCDIWRSLVSHLVDLINNAGKESEAWLIPLLASLEELIDGNFVPPLTSLKLMEIIAVKMSPHALSHPKKSLQTKGNLHGNAAIFLLQMAFSPRVLKEGQKQERFHITFEKLVSSGIQSSSNQLQHIHSALDLLDMVADQLEKKETLWRLWTSVVSPLDELISKTNDVNQGNALEHDFSGVELALVIPYRCLIDSNLNQALVKTTNKALSELYRRFSCAAALVPTADANTSAEELSAKLLTLMNERNTKDVVFLDSMVILMATILDCVDFSNPTLFDLATTAAAKSPNRTPTKWNKKQERPLGNLTSLVILIGRLTEASCMLINDEATSNKHFGILAWLMTNLVEVVSSLLSHVSGSVVISATLQILASPLVPVIQGAHLSTKEKKTDGEKKLFNLKFIQKVEKLWVDILTCIQSRYDGTYNSQLLSLLSPLLEIALCHSRRQLKNQAVMFWNATFAHAETLEYPESLRPVLQIVKDKMFLNLPNWDTAKVSVKDSQTPEQECEELSQFPQQSEFTKPRPILGSPVRRKPLTFSAGSPRIQGSFLHKASEAEKAVEHLSPRKAQTEPRPGTKGRTASANTNARRKLPLSIFDDDSQDYVAIAASPTKKRVLTEHQKEVMRERRVVPAMYNVLDQSQDGSMFLSTQDTTWTPSPQNMPAPFPKPKVDENGNEQKEESNTEGIPPNVENASNQMAPEKKTVEVVETQELDLPEEHDDDEPEGISSIPTTPEKDDPVEMTSSVTSPDTKADPLMPSVVTSSGVDDVMSSPERHERAGEEVTSPDMIPSSQSSIESNSSFQFQSLRRKSLNASLNKAVVLLSDLKEKEKVLPVAASLKDVDVTMESQSSEDNTVETDSVSDEQEENSEEVTNSAEPDSPSRDTMLLVSPGSRISPVARRTRRGKKLKATTPQSVTKTRTSKRRKPAKEKLENEEKPEKEQIKDAPIVAPVIEIDEKEEVETEEVTKSAIPESAALNREATASPVSCAKIKFMKPNTGSPTRAPIRLYSPVASPSTGILKRVTSLGKAADSPSPPNKVRRVSFALPLKQSDDSNLPASPDKVTSQEPNIPEPASEPPTIKTTPSRETGQAFTIIKRRRSAPAAVTKPVDLTDSVFPELSECTIPVEQILPSLCAPSWSRGLGHVVHAQNIRTIGNLSVLKEHQIRNLPIRSPKVENLRNVLSRFHQKTKSPRTRLVMKETTEKPEKLETVVEDEKVEKNTVHGKKDEIEDVSSKVAGVIAEESQEVSEKSQGMVENTCVRDSSEGKEGSETVCEAVPEHIVLDSREKVELIEWKEEGNSKEGEETREDKNEDEAMASVGSDEDTQENEEMDKPDEKSYTPPLPAPDFQNKQQDVDSVTTPKRSAEGKPTLLFDSVTKEENECDEEKNSESTPASVESMDVDTLNYLEETESEGAELGAPEKGSTNVSKDEREPKYSTTKEVEIPTEPCEGKKLCESLNTILEMATPDVLARLSSGEIFTAHQNLSVLMSRVVDALKVRWQSPTQKK